MIETIIKSAVSFCEHQLAKTCTKEEGLCLESLFIADIDMFNNKNKAQISVGITKPMLQYINLIFLDEHDSDTEELINMLLEVTNMIIGSAKVLIQNEQNSEYFIGLPSFKEYGTMACESDQAVTFRSDCGSIVICIKDMHE